MVPRLIIVGFGNLGQAIARGAIKSGIAAPSEIGAIDPEPAQRARAGAQGLRMADPSMILETEIVLLAVKPQHFGVAAESIGAVPTSGPIVVSVMAGIRSNAIRDALGGSARVVRAMPNTPAAVGRAITSVASDADVIDEDLVRVEQLFASVGKTVRVPEALFDTVTAVSGSGPAFVYRFLEAWCTAAESLGLPEDKATTLARETLIGAAALLEKTDDEPHVLRARVTSKGGTTSAGLARMEDAAMRGGGIDLLMLETLRAARDRGAELGRA